MCLEFRTVNRSLPPWLLVLATVPAILMTLTGCAVSMAVDQPTKKNLDLLEAGASRSCLIAEFGMPASTRWINKRRVDRFEFVQGYSRSLRAGRALAHGAADLATGGVWEAVATPAEGHFSGKHVAYEVSYDEQNRVRRFREVDPQNPAPERPSPLALHHPLYRRALPLQPN
jgi:hypothetical protein